MLKHLSSVLTLIWLFSLASWCSAQPVRTSQHAGLRSKVKVEVFTTNTCEPCKKLEKFLMEMKVPFIRYDLNKNKAARQDYYKNIGRGKIPVTRIGGRIVIRGDEPAKVYQTILKQQKSTPITSPRRDDIFHSPPKAKKPRSDKMDDKTNSVRPKEEFALP